MLKTHQGVLGRQEHQPGCILSKGLTLRTGLIKVRNNNSTLGQDERLLHRTEKRMEGAGQTSFLSFPD